MDVFINFIEKIHPLTNETLKSFLEISEVISYRSGDHLCELGAVNNKMFFVLNGVTRTYMKEDPNAHEINKSIASKGSLATSLKSVIDDEPAKIACQALTDCVIVVTTETALAKLRSENAEFAKFMYKALEVEYTKLEEAYIELLSKNATERYLSLRQRIKDIDQLIPQYHIASHLGITPIQLSRIRKKLLTQ